MHASAGSVPEKHKKNKKRMSPVRMGVIALCLIHRRTDSLGYLVAASIRTVGYPFTVRFRASDVLKIRVHVCKQNLLPGLG